ncbi:TerC family protein [Bacillus sp. SM2101]|uniref:TerC family protein n=1 Tax=Bacillus sp. SM2101 TaxID=2805366 RepID=UPI001BDF391F|nr:TerC family protein [Bacillus sp. SM2101]
MIEFFQEIFNSYASFFSLEAIKQVVSDPTNWTIIGSLIILEGLLSADNALVLAVMVKHLPEKQKKKALFYGILGAYVFRFIAIGLGVILIKITWVKILGGAYLLWLAISHFIKKHSEKKVKNKKMGFWRTVLAVELMDIAFSIDSVIAAFGVSSEIWVIFIGGMLGVLMMRGIAQVFLALIERIPELETAAFVLIAIIGLKMLAAATLGIHVEEGLFFGILLAVFAVTFIIHYVRRSGKQAEVRSNTEGTELGE